MKQLISIILITFSVNIFFAKADEVQLTASSPKVVAVGEQFKITYSVNKKGSSLQVPPFNNFHLLYGPNTSTSSSVQIVNGKMTQTASYTYTYVVQAKAEGIFQISPATIKVGRKEYKSNTLKIEVVANRNNQQNTSDSRSNSQTQNKQSNEIADEDLFVRVSVDKTNLYQGEYIIATIKVYTRVDLSGFADIKFPSYNGFWTQDIETPGQISLQRENYNGQIYNVGLFKKTLLYPQRSGKIRIDPFVLECQVRQTVRRRSRSIFDDFFGSYQNTLKRVTSKPITINVKDLPTNQPVSFNGAVGSFKFVAALDNNQVKANEAITLKLQVSGSGNLKLINPLKIDFPPDFETYDPKTTSSIKNTLNGQVGSKSFEYLIIPRFAGTFRLAPIEFSYFDSKTKKYKTLRSKEFVIKVEKGEKNGNVAIISGFSKEDVKYIGTDIRYIKTKPIVLHIKGKYLFGSLKFYLAYLISFVLFILIIFVKREQIKKNADVLRVKNRKAGKISRKRLKSAKKYLNENSTEKFYDEILNAIWGYLSDKLSIPLADLSKDTAFGNEKIQLIDSDIRNDLATIVETCEMARYAPSTVELGKEQIYKNAIKLIVKLEQKIR